jgi:hypothetical protein
MAMCIPKWQSLVDEGEDAPADGPPKYFDYEYDEEDEQEDED